MFSQYRPGSLNPNQRFDILIKAFSDLKIENPNYQSDAKTILSKTFKLLLTKTCSHPTIRFCNYYAAVLQHNINSKNWEELEKTLEQYFDTFKQLCLKYPKKISKYGEMLHYGYSALLDALNTKNAGKFKEIEARYYQVCQFDKLQKTASAHSFPAEAKALPSSYAVTSLSLAKAPTALVLQTAPSSFEIKYEDTRKDAQTLVSECLQLIETAMQNANARCIQTESTHLHLIKKLGELEKLIKQINSALQRPHLSTHDQSLLMDARKVMSLLTMPPNGNVNYQHYIDTMKQLLEEKEISLDGAAVFSTALRQTLFQMAKLILVKMTATKTRGEKISRDSNPEEPQAKHPRQECKDESKTQGDSKSAISLALASCAESAKEKVFSG